MLAELVVGKAISFKLNLKKEHPSPFKIIVGDESLVQVFNNKSASHFELSFVDNRIIKLRIENVEHSIMFQNVCKKHQFAELFKM